MITDKTGVYRSPAHYNECYHNVMYVLIKNTNTKKESKVQ